jgi:hypothetical protein
MKKLAASMVSFCLFATSIAFAGIDSDKAAYRGGTLPIKAGDEAKVDLMNPEVFRFLSKKAPAEIAYSKIQSIEYGQKAGRRIGAAVGLAIVAGPIGLLALASKKRKHMVSVTWESQPGKNEAAVFEFGKDSIRGALKTLEARSGKQIEYESEDARKNIGR